MNLLVERLRAYVPGLSASAGDLAHALTMVGVAVDRIGGAGDTAVLETDITTNRPDLLSYLGTAREASARYRLALAPPPTAPVESDEPAAGAVAVAIEAPDLCPRYSARVVAEVAVGPSPAWLREVLAASGIRSINNVVDVTNFVLLELGQPTHAFDLERLTGRRVVVRRAGPAATIRTLDGIDRRLDPDDLVIADAARPLAVAGVMGGADTEISAATRRVLIESAFFDPRAVRRTARRLGLRTEASVRFERRADPEVTAAAADRVARLLSEVASGRVLRGVIDALPAPLVPPRLRLRLSQVARVLGQAVEGPEVVRILTALGFRLRPPTGVDGVIEVEVPGFRGDVEREIDLIEEIGRHSGYDHLPAALPPAPLPPPGLSRRQERERLLHRVLQGAGWSEVVTVSMVDPAREEPVAAGVPLVRIQNPLSDRLSALRATVLGGLLEVIGHNRRHGAAAVAVYEVAHVFQALAGGGHREVPRLGLAVGGGDADERTIRGALEAIGGVLRLGPLVVQPGDYPAGPARFTWAAAGGGEIHRLAGDLLERHDIEGSAVVHAAEIDLAPLLDHDPGTIRYRPFSRFPPSTRDVSLWLGGAAYGEVRSVLDALAEPLVEDVSLVDRYAGDDDVAVTLRLTYRHPDRTLENDEVQAAHGRVLAALGRDPRLRLRLG